MEFDELVAKNKSNDQLNVLDPLKGLTSTREDELERITLSKEGKLPQGLKTGYDNLDSYLRLKIGNLLIINGHANVGKSYGAWYLMTIANKLYGWRWIMFCAENISADIRTQIVEFICGKVAKFIPNEEFETVLNHVYDSFEIIEIDDEKDMEENLSNILEITESIMKEKGKFQGVLIDPYNSIDLDIGKMDKRLSIHDLHYQNAKKMRKFCAKHNVTFWVSMHAVTEALRRTDAEGYPIPPNPSDTEGGGKWFNRADEFMTFHRYVQDSARSTISEFHIRKVKDTKTGGRPSDLNNPPKLEWKKHNGFLGFFDDDGNCPLAPLTEVGLNKMPVVETLPQTGKELSRFESESKDPDAPF